MLGTHQGSPNAVLEAMAAGIPVIANDSGGTRESVIDGETGWLLSEAADCPELSAAMAHAAGDPARARALGSAARARVRARNSIEAMARRYLAILAPETRVAHEKMAGWIPAIGSPPISALPASNR